VSAEYWANTVFIFLFQAQAPHLTKKGEGWNDPLVDKDGG